MSRQTVRELLPAIGARVLVRFESLAIACVVKDAKERLGQGTPAGVAGRGKRRAVDRAGPSGGRTGGGGAGMKLTERQRAVLAHLRAVGCTGSGHDGSVLRALERKGLARQSHNSAPGYVYYTWSLTEQGTKETNQ